MNIDAEQPLAIMVHPYIYAFGGSSTTDAYEYHKMEFSLSSVFMIICLLSSFYTKYAVPPYINDSNHIQNLPTFYLLLIPTLSHPPSIYDQHCKIHPTISHTMQNLMLQDMFVQNLPFQYIFKILILMDLMNVTNF